MQMECLCVVGQVPSNELGQLEKFHGSNCAIKESWGLEAEVFRGLVTRRKHRRTPRKPSPRGGVCMTMGSRRISVWRLRKLSRQLPTTWFPDKKGTEI